MLGTRDPIEAKRLHALKLAEVEERWANLRAGQRPFTPDDIAREAAAIGNSVRRQLDADPYQALSWDVDVGARIGCRLTVAALTIQMPHSLYLRWSEKSWISNGYVMRSLMNMSVQEG